MSSFDDIRKQIRRGYKKNATEEEQGMARAWEAYKRQMWEDDPRNPNRKTQSEEPKKRGWEPPDWDG